MLAFVFAGVCGLEAQNMRKIIGLVAVAVMLVGSRVASAQFVDPSTGVPVDPTTDPMDFANAMSGQPTNIGMELAAQATEQMQGTAQQMQVAAQPSSVFPTDSDNTAPSGPAIATTLKPALTPNGGSFRASVQVAIADKDADALIHYTTDGSKPTSASPLYLAPFTVTAKTKVRAIAAVAGDRNSSVVTKTFKVKS
ncbi:MAG TPA: chitobiase/beta-hexosaminidase C-terminal domain-containing protein [Acidobacteriaceae bacterium]